MDRMQRGFTLIELVVVIVLLGILAAVAFPKFQDLSTSGQSAVVQGTEAAFISAAVITLGKNQGSVPTFASVLPNVNFDAATSISGTCPANVVVQYVSNPAVSVTIPAASLTGFCNG